MGHLGQQNRASATHQALEALVGRKRRSSRAPKTLLFEVPICILLHCVTDVGLCLRQRDAKFQSHPSAKPTSYFAVFFEVGFHRIFRVASAVNYVALATTTISEHHEENSPGVGVVCSLLVTSSLVMLCRFSVMASGMREMFGCLLVMFCNFL